MITLSVFVVLLSEVNVVAVIVVFLELPVVEGFDDKLIVEDFVLLAITSVPETITTAITRIATKVSILFFNFGYYLDPMWREDGEII